MFNQIFFTMLTIEKLSEKNLYEVLTTLFPTTEIIKQKSFSNGRRRMIVDYYMEIDSCQIAIEFDGPTHFTRTSTQIRDLDLEDYCTYNNIMLVRIPYFIQINDRTLYWLFGYDMVVKYDLEDKVTCLYDHGFIDKGCVLPGDYNAHGVELYCEIYRSLILADCWSVVQSIFDSSKQYSEDNFIGLYPTEELQMLWDNYPT